MVGTSAMDGDMDGEKLKRPWDQPCRMRIRMGLSEVNNQTQLDKMYILNIRIIIKICSDRDAIK